MKLKVMENLKKKILQKKAIISVIGLGYVGLPLAVEFAKKGFLVLGVDTDKERIKKINSANSYISDVPSARLKPLLKKTLKCYPDYSKLKQADVIIIAVPTPLSKTRSPDISFILKATRKISKTIKRNQLIILESTTYPGTTRDVVLPLLEESGLKGGEDFLLAFSPERVDPGNKKYKTRNIPKVVGGINGESTQLAGFLYSQIVERVISVSSPEIAEMTKLWENTFRAVNIGLANEMALICHKMNIDAWEVIAAARTKPFGFLPFYPGPGLGGHCLPVDPLYFSYKAGLKGIEARFIRLADEINSAMPNYVVERIKKILKRAKRALCNSKILILGITYKKNIADIRESPAIEIIKILSRRKARVSYFDPFIEKIKLGKRIFRSHPLSRRFLSQQDCVVIVTDHSLDYNFIVHNSPYILDTRNVLSNIKGVEKKKIEKL